MIFSSEILISLNLITLNTIVTTKFVACNICCLLIIKDQLSGLANLSHYTTTTFIEFTKI